MPRPDSFGRNTMPDVTIAKIAVSGIPFRLDRPFDYAIPLDMKEKVQPGVEWRCPSRARTAARRA